MFEIFQGKSAMVPKINTVGLILLTVRGILEMITH